jgi:thiol-disulfide isomerase/thioredoxin
MQIMKVENILKSGILLLMLFIVGYVAYQRFFPASALNEAGRLERLPKFSFPAIGKGGKIAKSDLRGGKTVVLYFSPDCEHCQLLGNDIGQQLGKLRDIDFVFVTRFDEADAIAYAKRFGLWEQPNIYWGLDVDAAFYGYFGEMFIPSAYIFGEKDKFLQSVHQNAMVQDLLDVLAGIPSDKNKATR